MVSEGTSQTPRPKIDVKAHAKRMGYVWRGSDKVENVVNKRYAALSADVFVTYRRETDKEPSKYWPLHSSCELSQVEQQELMLSNDGYNNVVAWLSGKFERVEGFAFTVSWPKSRLMKDTDLVLAFKNEDHAYEWHASFVNAISALLPGDLLPMRPTTMTASEQDDNFRTLEDAEDRRAEGPSDMNGASTPAQSIGGDLSTPSTSSSSHWRPIRLINGMAVYYEEDESGGAYMVSTIVRSTPRACLDTLLTGSFLLGSSDLSLLQRDGDLELLRLYLRPPGLASWLLNPRELVIERTWREEEDGTIVVLFKSNNAQDDRQKQETSNGFFSWLASPVEAQIPAAGFTISPLREEYLRMPSATPESLITLVLKMDLGGVCSTGSLFKPVLDGLGMCQSWIERILTTVLVLRDTVEQSRFTVRLSRASSLKPRRPATEAGVIRTTTNMILGSFPIHGITVDEDVGSEDSDQPPVRGMDGVLNPRFWASPGSAGFRVRGLHYLKDKKKVPAGNPKFDLDWVYLLKLKKPTRDIAQFLPALRTGPTDFTFVVQIIIPGPKHMSLVIGWTRQLEAEVPGTPASHEPQKSVELDAMDPFDLSLVRFVRGTDELRDSMFKLIPSVVEGSWIIRQSVGHTPVIMGRKLKQSYHRGEGYFEVDIDVASSRTASTVVGLVSGATRSLCVDLAILFEGKREEELPESLLGTVRLDHVDLDTAIPLEAIMQDQQENLVNEM